MLNIVVESAIKVKYAVQAVLNRPHTEFWKKKHEKVYKEKISKTKAGLTKKNMIDVQLSFNKYNFLPTHSYSSHKMQGSGSAPKQHDVQPAAILGKFIVQKVGVVNLG